MKRDELTDILSLFGLKDGQLHIETISNGLINGTWKVKAEKGNYVLQQINTSIFTKPELIDDNLIKINKHLSHFHPDYLFVAPLPAINGKTLIKDKQNSYFRLFPFIPNSHSINVAGSPQQAFEAAKQFGKFTRALSGFDASALNITLPDFHNVSLRFFRFTEAVQKASATLFTKAEPLIEEIFSQQAIVTKYQEIVSHKLLPLRVCHHDTKISNVLFDDNNKGLCVIDLDTVMPGYIISDVGDMLRTYLSPCNEEETDMNKIAIRIDYFSAIIKGYQSEMNLILTKEEKELLVYSGKMMMYMQAMRFLADFLHDDIYYQITYPLQNLNRAKNQLTLLKRFTEAEPDLMILLS